MKQAFTGGKRAREAERDWRHKEKEQRLRRNRDLRARGLKPAGGEIEPFAEPLSEVKLVDIVLGVPPRPGRASPGPVKLFVGGLSFDTTSEALRAHFAAFGQLIEAKVIADRGTGRSRGFGFVTLANARDADECIRKTDGAELEGRTLKVNRAEAR